jgi:hypothetical protein
MVSTVGHVKKFSNRGNGWDARGVEIRIETVELLIYQWRLRRGLP